MSDHPGLRPTLGTLILAIVGWGIAVTLVILGVHLLDTLIRP